MKKIIVPIDFSQQSGYALKVAVLLAKKYDAEIFALHTLELAKDTTYTMEMIYEDQTAFHLKKAEKKLSKFLDQPFLKGVKVIPVIKHNQVYEEINNVAKEQDADLVIMGSHGVDGLKEIFIGSNTEKVVRHSNIPVMVIKNDYLEFKIDRFVFALNLKQDNVITFQKALAFAEMVSAKLDFVYVNTPGEKFLSTDEINERIKKFFEKEPMDVPVNVYNDYSVEKGILNYAKNTGADIIGMSTHGYKGLSHFFMGSIGEDVANHAKIPVVTLKV